MTTGLTPWRVSAERPFTALMILPLSAKQNRVMTVNGEIPLFTCANEKYVVCFSTWYADLWVHSYLCESVATNKQAISYLITNGYLEYVTLTGNLF